jgi:squalene-hopene/tetraprenyl-beta-curcumene cyclase
MTSPMMPTELSATKSKVQKALASAARELLDRRTRGGYWVGELSSSALSTATAVFALRLYEKQNPGKGGDSDVRHRLITGGICWLVSNQNADGGWGDTTLSRSNISTTAICWAALRGHGADAAPAIASAESWLASQAGSPDATALARAITDRYGKDRTFAVPILTMCALAGCFGEGRGAWRTIPQLPFELAALPQSWFRFLRLPVVSYALPGLIAIGLVRHHRRPTRNPLARTIRRMSTARALTVLKKIQPAGGGFLEATPLTSFVVMSLVAGGRADHAVTHAGVDFLIRSARPDGSWPIDTNLATWVTTLSINALAAADGASAVARTLSREDRRAIRDWLLNQQYRTRHPYTGAAPGGWAWTDLPGGVPDADDTAGALLALHHLGDRDRRVIEAAENGAAWLADLQNNDGGIPTFCRGWTNLPFDRSGADLTAHAILAWRAWRDAVNPTLASRLRKAEQKALNYLKATQLPEGSWSPLWFGNQWAADETNCVYGTAKVLIALAVTGALPSCLLRAVDWLASVQGSDGGWGGGTSGTSSIEETGLAVDALSHCVAVINDPGRKAAIGAALKRGQSWLIERSNGEARFTPAPIGLYFAKLWYFERSYPLVFALGGLASALASGRDEDELRPPI